MMAAAARVKAIAVGAACAVGAVGRVGAMGAIGAMGAMGAIGAIGAIGAACSSGGHSPASGTGAAAGARAGDAVASGAGGASGAAIGAIGAASGAGAAHGSSGAGGAASGSSSMGNASGRVVAHVTWAGAPAEARADGPRNPCGVARRPRARVGTLHGVAGAVVVVDGQPASPAAVPPVLALRDCRVEPAVSLAAIGGYVEVVAVDARRQRVALAPVDAKLAPPWAGAAGSGASRGAIDLAWAGDDVVTAIGGDGAVRVATDASPDEPSWIVAPADTAAITDDTGAATFTLAVGRYHLTAWLPPTVDGAAAMIASVDVDVFAGKDVDAALPLVAP